MFLYFFLSIFSALDHKNHSTVIRIVHLKFGLQPYHVLACIITSN